MTKIFSVLLLAVFCLFAFTDLSDAGPRRRQARQDRRMSRRMGMSGGIMSSYGGGMMHSSAGGCSSGSCGS